jgi:hypothetical protein
VKRHESKDWQRLISHELRINNSAKQGGHNMQPPNEVLCNLFVPLLITLGLICTVALQYAFNGDDF